MTLTHNAMEADIERTLISRERISRRLDELAREIVAAYPLNGEGLVVVPILDLNSYYRNWPDIAVLRPELYR